ncbi:ABC transporter ATP-binding protein [Rhodonellum sp.]|uniref:ABC transporter ATP-binding protein n=1 Tax=Rhodonellum sp. TaxID=2231180 RepID=UPI00271E8AE5|nr:ATP-binding cassette domain-containing protein [Rhodonellum sp.]MDO9552043.1 ATP-binding cassette domain-containing protein [Rhodonellum sp.]
MEILKIQDLSKSFGQQPALSHIDLVVPRGVIFGLLGPNGAGKTTLIRIINQIIDGDSGLILFKGEPLSSKHISQIGYLPEERGLYKKMKVWDQLIYFARLKGMSASMAKEKVKYWLEKLEISSWREKRIEDLSKGMAQKVQFISTVIHEPELLILDEPFSGFDPMNAEIIKNEILELKDKGITVVLSTHRMESVELLCDEIAMIHKSKKILEGKLSDIKRKFRPHVYQVALSPNGTQMPAEWEIHRTSDKVEIQVPLNGKKPNQLLLELMSFGDILEFREILPTMEELFIQQVKSHPHG